MLWKLYPVYIFAFRLLIIFLTLRLSLNVYQPEFLCLSVQFSSVQSLIVSDCLQTHELQHARPPCPSPTSRVHSNSPPWVGDAIQPSHPLSSPSPPAPNPSQHQSLSNESALCMRWPKYWSFSFSIILQKTPRTDLF